MKYVTCPECEANFAEAVMKDGRFPPHKFLGKPCPGALNVKRDINPPRKRSKAGINVKDRPTGPHSAFFVETWEERDRLHIALYFDPDHAGRGKRGERYAGDGQEVASWWDDDARQMFEDGFFNARDLSGSVIEYAQQMNMIEVT